MCVRVCLCACVYLNTIWKSVLLFQFKFPHKKTKEQLIKKQNKWKL